MVRKVKKFKAGFVVSDANLTPNDTLKEVLAIKASTGHSTIGITADGTSNGKLLGIVTSRDYRESKRRSGYKNQRIHDPILETGYRRTGHFAY